MHVLSEKQLKSVPLNDDILPQLSRIESFHRQVGYNGPIYMTQPTKAIAPILLEDMRKVAVDRKGETNFFTSQMIKDCMKKVVPVGLHQGCQIHTQKDSDGSRVNFQFQPSQFYNLQA